MKVVMLLALASLSSTALSAPVYKCKNEKGETVFTDKKCDFDSQQKRVWDNHLGDTEYPAAMSGSSPDEMRGSGERTTFADTAVESRRDADGGYFCSTPTRSWVQDSPCPRITTEPRTTVITHSDGRWTQIDSNSPTAVSQDKLSHAGLCAQLTRNSNADESAYERRRMKKDNDCP